MTLPYTGETITHEGKTFKVLDIAKVDCSATQRGRKKAETFTRRAKGGEVIDTYNTKGEKENGKEYICQPGDAIFVNLHNAKDTYVPGNPQRWKFDDLEKIGYEITKGSKASGEMYVKATESFNILHEAVKENTCIKDAWGPGGHQFLYEGATLKVNTNGWITGIDKTAFDATWEIFTLPKPAAAKIPKFKA